MAINNDNNDIINITIDFNQKTKDVIFSNIEKLFRHNKLTENEINNLLDKSYSKNTFDLNFTFLKEIDSNINISLQRQDNIGNNRYYSQPVNNKYLLCHEWFAKGKKLFAEWLQNLDPSVIVDVIQLTNDQPINEYLQTNNFLNPQDIEENNDILNIKIDFNQKTKNVVLPIMEKLFEQNKLSEDEINNLLNENYSKNTFNLNFALLKKIDPNIDINTQRKDSYNYNRYYGKPLNNRYLLCKEWFVNDKPLFTKWLQNLDPSIIVNVIPLVNDEDTKTSKNPYILDEIENITLEQMYILLLFIAKFGEDALTSFTTKRYIQAFDLITNKITEIQIQASSLYTTKYNFTKALTENTPLTGTAENIYNQYKDYDIQQFKELILTFNDDNPNLLNKEEVITLLFLLARLKNHMLEVFNCTNDTAFYNLIIPHRSFQKYSTTATLASMKSDLQNYINDKPSLSSPNIKLLCDQLINKNMNDFTPLIDKLKSLQKKVNINDYTTEDNTTQDTTLLNKDEVLTLLFLVAKFKEQTLREFNCRVKQDLYRLIVSIKAITIYDSLTALNTSEGEIARHLHDKDSYIPKDSKRILYENEHKEFEDFQEFINRVKFLQNKDDLHIPEITKAQPLNKPHNRIIYGAPGTGKSYLLNNEIKKLKEIQDLEYTRVTFYDGYTHGQFVGSYKPIPKGDSITYAYVAGPLMKSIVNAVNNPDKNYCLIIEEINRARADKVFGNTFQLLDRKEDGSSEYSIDLSDEQQEFLNKCDIDEEKLYFPENLYIWATMNSADQGVYVLDSAFKRRWSFEHIGLNENQENFGESTINYQVNYTQEKSTNWNHFRTTINNILMNVNVIEDKLLAPFFIKPSDFITENNITVLKENVFISKILMYLFDDILKHKSKDTLFISEIKTFSQLKETYKKGKEIFNHEIISELETTQQEANNEQ